MPPLRPNPLRFAIPFVTLFAGVAWSLWGLRDLAMSFPDLGNPWAPDYRWQPSCYALIPSGDASRVLWASPRDPSSWAGFPDFIRLAGRQDSTALPYAIRWIADTSTTGKAPPAAWSPAGKDSLDLHLGGWPIGATLRFPIRGGNGRGVLFSDAGDRFPASPYFAVPIHCP